MNSCLYRCRVLHDRQRPRSHRFAYECFVFCLDLDEVSALERRLWGFSRNRSNVYSLRDSDHLDEGADTIRANLTRYLRRQGIEEPIGQTLLVTNLRVWGYVFNPVSFYFVKNRHGAPLCAVAEVANTFNERKLYLIRPQEPSSGRYRQTHDKQFYISPFSDLDTRMEFDLATPAGRLNLRISESDAEGRYFHSALAGSRRELTNRSLLAATLRFPFMTLSVIAAIHWQAAKLALIKKLPCRRKRDNPQLQTDVRPYLPKHSERLPREAL